MAPRLFLCMLVVGVSLFGQELKPSAHVDVNYFYGTLLRHNKDIAHLIRNHPTGTVVGYNIKTHGNKQWHREYGMPDWGFSLLYKDPHNAVLGRNIGLYSHLNIYGLNRHLMTRVGFGLAYNTNPFDLDTNFKNNAYGTHLLSSVYLMASYQQTIWNRLGMQTGLTLIHYSNGNLRSPNSSTNTVAFHVGVTYDLLPKEVPQPFDSESVEKGSEPIHWNLVVRGGVNESDYVGLGQRPFWSMGAYADKRLSYKSSIQLGVELFLSGSIKREIEYLKASGLDRSLTGTEDAKRVGLFAGHELHIGKIGFVTQAGYYLYYPYDFEGRFYLRGGLKYFITTSLFAAGTIKAHGGQAEGIELGLGWRL